MGATPQQVLERKSYLPTKLEKIQFATMLESGATYRKACVFEITVVALLRFSF